MTDTRREDVGAAGPDSAAGRGVQVPDYYGDGHLEITAQPDREYADITLNTYGHWSIDTTVAKLVAAIEEAGGPRLTALPAPPVAYEAEVEDRLAEIRSIDATVNRAIHKAKEEAWDQGRAAGWADNDREWVESGTKPGDDFQPTPNPYRDEAP